jgi:hypothetical protein
MLLSIQKEASFDFQSSGHLFFLEYFLYFEKMKENLLSVYPLTPESESAGARREAVAS